MKRIQRKIQIIKQILIYLSIDFISNFKKNTHVKEIIVVRLDAIGDFIIWQDAAKELKKIYPNRKIILVCNSIYKELAEKLPFYDEVISLNIKEFENNILYRFKFLWHLKSKKYEVALSPVYSRTFLLSDWLIKNIRAKEKIGNEGDLANISKTQRNISNRWYTKLIKSSNGIEMEIIKNAKFIRALGLKEYKGKISNLRTTIKWPEEIKFKVSKDYMVLFLGASDLKKCWAPEKFAEVIKRLEEKYIIVLLGVESEKELGERFLLKIENKEIVENFIGKTSLIETMEIIKNAKLVLGNDSASVHMAAALNIPSISILGGGYFGRFMPYVVEENLYGVKPIEITVDDRSCFNCNWQCIYSSSKTTWKCIRDVKIEKVLINIKSIIKKERSL